MQATMWLGQLNGGIKMRGGQTNLFPDDLNVAAVPTDQLLAFTVAHNTYAHTYHAPTKTWYKDGKVWSDYTYPAQYTMQDGSLLTVGFDKQTQLLILTQT